MNQFIQEVEKNKAEIRRLRGIIERVIIGGVIIPANITGTAPVPSAVDGAIIIGNASSGWERLARSIPAANVRNVLGLDNGDSRPSWKTALSSTTPTPSAFGDGGTPGTSLVFSHVDHRHQMDDVYITNMAAAL